MAVKRSYPVVKMPQPCPGCSAKMGKETQVTGVYHCTGCKGTVGTCYRGEAMALVEFDKPMENGRDGEMRYFDFTFIDTRVRIHGWFDRQTQRVVQIG